MLKLGNAEQIDGRGRARVEVVRERWREKDSEREEEETKNGQCGQWKRKLTTKIKILT